MRDRYGRVCATISTLFCQTGHEIHHRALPWYLPSAAQPSDTAGCGELSSHCICRQRRAESDHLDDAGKRGRSAAQCVGDTAWA
ncbi:MAG: hypothetical protein ACK55I_05955, partial [bacterium]